MIYPDWFNICDSSTLEIRRKDDNTLEWKHQELSDDYWVGVDAPDMNLAVNILRSMGYIVRVLGNEEIEDGC